MWQIQRVDRTTGQWRNIRSTEQYAGIRIDCPIEESSKAFAAALVWAERLHVPSNKVRVINLDTNTPVNEGDTVTPDLNKPLTIPRETLITRLQENLDAEVAKRTEAEAEQTKAREEVLAAIAEFTPDELYNIFFSRWVVDLDGLKLAKERKTWVTEEIKPTKKESDLEKFVRILGYASDKDIELLPNQELFSLL